MMDALALARQAKDEGHTWPWLHWLWPQRPILEWLADHVLTTFGRHRAPMLQSPGWQPTNRPS